MNRWSSVLAKSEPKTTLRQHIDDCLNILCQLKEVLPNIPIDESNAFWKSLRLSIILHDTGKAHVEFQRYLLGKPNKWYHQRHELFSLYFALNSDCQEQLCSSGVLAILGHHKSLSDLYDFIDKNYSENEWFIDDEGLTYDDECQKLNPCMVWNLMEFYGISQKTNRCIALKPILKNYIKSSKGIRDKQTIKNILSVGMLKQCDHMASAGIEKLNVLGLNDFTYLDKYSLYTHQRQDGEKIGNVILTAPTGTGKTESAMNWLRNQIRDRGNGRVFYILPYTASINAMYERLSCAMGNGKVGMLHGKLLQYLESRFSESSDDNLVIRKMVNDFKTMITPFKVATPFQLLKNLYGLKGFEKGIVEWAGAYFVIDEIHAYDARTFAQLMVLLHFAVTQLNVRVHVMTATLPTFMRKELAAVLTPFHNVIADKELYTSLVRHKAVLKEGALLDNISLIQEYIDKGKKVLVVCNTVDDAQCVYQTLDSEHKVLLHGRFCARDRNVKEKFLSNPATQVLVGTQAIEVSLDIDYDILFTSPAPIDALVQRFGRINRKCKKGICPCVIFREPGENDHFVYKNKDVVSRTIQAFEMIVDNDGGIVREDSLQKYMDYVYPCWEENERNEYEDTKRIFEKFMYDEMAPLEYSEQREEDYYRQFDGQKVLPMVLVDEYQQKISDYEFVKADSLLVSISTGRFKALLNSGLIDMKSFTYPTDNDKVKTRKEFVIKTSYNSELGLQFTVDGDNNGQQEEDNFL